MIVVVDDEIRIILGKMWSQMRRDCSQSLRELHIHVGQEHALCQLWQEEGITQIQLSERLGCEPPTTSNMIKKLEEYGLVHRQQDEADARITRVYLTDEGRALEQPIKQMWQKQQEKLLDGIHLEERLLLRRVLQQMLNNLS
ncbi:MarR family transcriptional regulator [Paenibacillus sp. S3N08]|uniref:MarR family transcriptional regulator n=2 Tax=Paenibacillus agricola TaxID=2716264 RepID=A0ABX0J761_9BACL|nr:MarR family transcriptional regulator [Paenibacillus agricola]